MTIDLKRCASIVALAFAVLLSGCADTITAISDREDSRILNPDSVQGVRGPSNFLALDNRHPNQDAANDLRGGGDKTVAPTTSCFHEGPSAPLYRFLCRQARLEVAYDGNPHPSTSAGDLHVYVSAGITLSDELCSEWFLRLGIAQVTLRQTSDTISGTGSLTSAILAFTRAKTEAIGLAASVFGAAKTYSDSLAANYVVAVDLPTLKVALMSYRSIYGQQLLDTNYEDFYAARRAVMAYDDTCSALFVRHFVNDSIQGSTRTAESGVEVLADQAINSFLATSDTFFTSKPTPTQLYEIYAYLFLSPKRPADLLAQFSQISLKGPAGNVAFDTATDAQKTALRTAIMAKVIDGVLDQRAQAYLGDPAIPDTVAATPTAPPAATIVRAAPANLPPQVKQPAARP